PFYMFHFFFLLIPRPSISTLFPYTTLFRSELYGGLTPIRLSQSKDLPISSSRRCVSDNWLFKGKTPGAVYLVCFCDFERCDLIRDRKSTRLNSSHVAISYAVFCLKKKKK